MLQAPLCLALLGPGHRADVGHLRLVVDPGDQGAALG